MSYRQLWLLALAGAVPALAEPSVDQMALRLDHFL